MLSHTRTSLISTSSSSLPSTFSSSACVAPQLVAVAPLFSDHGTSCRVEAKEKGSERGGLSGVGMRRAALGGGLVSIGGNGSDGADDGPASEAEADVASTPLATSPMTLSLVGERSHTGKPSRTCGRGGCFGWRRGRKRSRDLGSFAQRWRSQRAVAPSRIISKPAEVANSMLSLALQPA